MKNLLKKMIICSLYIYYIKWGLRKRLEVKLPGREMSVYVLFD